MKRLKKKKTHNSKIRNYRFLVSLCLVKILLLLSLIDTFLVISCKLQKLSGSGKRYLTWSALRHSPLSFVYSVIMVGSILIFYLIWFWFFNFLLIVIKFNFSIFNLQFVDHLSVQVHIPRSRSLIMSFSKTNHKADLEKEKLLLCICETTTCID